MCGGRGLRGATMSGEYVKRVGLRYTFGSLFDPFVGFPFLDPIMSQSPRLARNAGIAVLVLLLVAAAAAYLWWRQLPGRMDDGCSLQERRSLFSGQQFQHPLHVARSPL